MDGYSTDGSTSFFTTDKPYDSQFGFETGSWSMDEGSQVDEIDWKTLFDGGSGSFNETNEIPLSAINDLPTELNQIETSEASFQTESESGAGKSKLTPAQREKKRRCDARYRQNQKRKAEEQVDVIQHLKEENERLTAENTILKQKIGLLLSNGNQLPLTSNEEAKQGNEADEAEKYSAENQEKGDRIRDLEGPKPQSANRNQWEFSNLEMENISNLDEQFQFERLPGIRFKPTDEELITHYLSKKVSNSLFSCTAIGEVDLTKYNPWDLPGIAKMGEEEWYFYVRDRKYPTGWRTNMATLPGSWRATGKARGIFNGESIVGTKKTLVFYLGKAPRDIRTSWVMHEFRLKDQDPIYNLPKTAKNEWVICKVFMKNDGGKRHISGFQNSDFDHQKQEDTSGYSSSTSFPMKPFSY